MIACYRASMSQIRLYLDVLFGLQPRGATASRSMSSEGHFTGTLSAVYAKAFEKHRPVWTHIVRSVQVALPERDGKILDIATGPGEPATSLAEAFPNAEVVATDVASEMVQQASERSAHLSNVKCLVASAEDLSAFQDESFDVLTVCYGHMFVGNLPLALQEARRVLKPGGCLITTFWNKVWSFSISTEILGELSPAETLDLDPTSLKEPGLMEGLLEKAGFIVAERQVGSYAFTAELGSSGFKGWTFPIMKTLDDMAKSDPEVKDRAYQIFENIVEREGFPIVDGRVSDNGNEYSLIVAKKL